MFSNNASNEWIYTDKNPIWQRKNVFATASGAVARGRYGRVFKYQPELSQIQIDAGNISLQIGK